MARKKAEPQSETPPEPTQEPRKPGGRTIGSWRKEAVNFLGKGADNSDVTAHIMKLATKAGFDYQTDDEETAGWRPRLQAEMDGTAPAAASRTRGKATASTEPTLTDLMAVLSEMKNADLPDLEGLSPVKAWTLLIEQVEALASKVGGVANLKRCLTTAASLLEFTKE